MSIQIASAGAGSGKTYKLMGLIRDAIQHKTCRPSGLIATTFTNQAAAELMERVRRELCEAGLLEEAQQLAEAMLGTVHGICGRLLQRFAFEAGISPRIQILDEAMAKLMLSQAIEDACAPAEVEQLERLTRRLGQYDSRTDEPLWKKQVTEVGNLARENAIDGARLAGIAAANVTELLAFLPSPTTEPLESKLDSALARAVDDLRASGNDAGVTKKAIAAFEAQRRILAAGRTAWSEWYKVAKIEPAVPVIPLIEPVVIAARRVDEHPGVRADLQAYIELVFGVAERALSAYQARKEARGFLDYADLEVRALALLDHPTVAEAIAADYDLLLVDECQDTNPLQLAIFLKLSALIKGQTTFVGDPKQAIYGFRGSDPELLAAALAYVRQQGGELTPLAKSYRTRPELTDLFNSNFAPAFGKTHNLSPGAVELTANRPTQPTLPPGLERWVISTGLVTKDKKHPKPKPAKKEDADKALAEGVVRILNEGYTVEDRDTKTIRPLRIGDIAILRRRNEDAADLAGALLDRGLAVTRETKGLLETPEVLLAMACLRRLLDPADSLAAAELIALDGCLTPEAWLEDRLAWLATNPSQTWGLEGKLAHPALLALEALRPQVLLLSPAEALDAALSAANLFGVVTGWGRTAARAGQRRANLEALRGLALTYEGAAETTHEPATLGGFLLWLKALAKSETDKIAVDQKADAVKVMTWHGSKGLEWPVVVCADLDHEPKPRLWNHVIAVQAPTFDVTNPLANRTLRFWPWPFGQQEKDVPLRAAVAASPVGVAASEAAAREELRLLYVGFTRTRDVLVLPFNEGNDPVWLDLVDRSGLAPAAKPALVQDEALQGRQVRTRLVLIPDPPVLPQVQPNLHWFPPPQPHTPKLPAMLAPSSVAATASAKLGRTIPLGGRLPLLGKFDEERLGTALHAILAAELLHGGTAPRPDLVEQVLAAHGVGTVVTAADALAMVARLRAGLTKEFQPTRVFVEVPFQYVNGDGQRVSGIIDLLLDTPAGWVIVDHKSYPGQSANWPEIALSYSGQVRCYREAMTLDGRPVCSAWIHFCTGGGLVEVLGL